MNEIIRGKGRLGCVNVNVVKVQNNKSRMLEERVIGTRRKLPAETNNGELLLLLFVTATDLRYQSTRLPIPNPQECCPETYVMWIRLVEDVFEYRYLHFP